MIVVTAKGMEKRLKRLLDSFSRRLSVLTVESCAVKLEGAQPDLVLLQQQRITKLECSHAIFILQKMDALPQSIVCPHTVAVLNSANPHTMKLVAKEHIGALTCGFSCADTFTLSSLMADSAVISLQRSLTAFDGTQIDPFDLPVRFSEKIDPFVLLACTAVCCLLGKKNPLGACSCWEISPEL